ncbi:MAG: hypothetical protein AAB582_01985 [Patescibacteria group bacterium]
MIEFIEEASDLFLLIASIGVVVITLVTIIVGYQLIKFLEAARALTQTLSAEVAVFSDGRKEIGLKARFALKWLRLMGSYLIKR